jgi:hypothetical protein
MSMFRRKLLSQPELNKYQLIHYFSGQDKSDNYIFADKVQNISDITPWTFNPYFGSAFSGDFYGDGYWKFDSEKNNSLVCSNGYNNQNWGKYFYIEMDFILPKLKTYNSSYSIFLFDLGSLNSVNNATGLYISNDMKQIALNDKWYDNNNTDAGGINVKLKENLSEVYPLHLNVKWGIEETKNHKGMEFMIINGVKYVTNVEFTTYRIGTDIFLNTKDYYIGSGVAYLGKYVPDMYFNYIKIWRKKL